MMTGSKHIGFATTGWSFARSARMLETQLNTGDLWLSHDMPIDHLFAHAIELMLKGLVLKHQPEAKVREDFGHRLLDLYNRLNSRTDTKSYISEAEKKVGNHWKRLLRDARDAHEATLGVELTDEDRCEFGSFSNAQISTSLPKLRDQIEWLAKRHGQNGDVFRYFQERLERRKVVQSMGVNLDVVRETAFQACIIFHEQITGRKPR